MLNKNYSDIAELAKAILTTLKKLKEESVNIDAEDVKVTVNVSKIELNTIDHELYEMTKEFNPGKEFIPSDKKVLVKLGGIDFTIMTEDAEKENEITVTAVTSEHQTAAATITEAKEEETPTIVEEVTVEEKPKETKKTTKTDTKKADKTKTKKK